MKFTLQGVTLAKVLQASIIKAGATTTVLATAGGTANLFSKLQPLIHILQDIALPVGIIVSTWGLIEIMIGNPGGKQKIKHSVIGYIGIFLIPFIFVTIRDALRGLI